MDSICLNHIEYSTGCAFTFSLNVILIVLQYICENETSIQCRMVLKLLQIPLFCFLIGVYRMLVLTTIFKSCLDCSAYIERKKAWILVFFQKSHTHAVSVPTSAAFERLGPHAFVSFVGIKAMLNY